MKRHFDENIQLNYDIANFNKLNLLANLIEK